MTTPIITVENLSKKYWIKHQNRKSYTTLRDSITDAAKNIAAAFRNFSLTFNSQPSTNSEEFWALKDVSFEINAGESVGVFGRNGAILGIAKTEIINYE